MQAIQSIREQHPRKANCKYWWRDRVICQLDVSPARDSSRTDTPVYSPDDINWDRLTQLGIEGLWLSHRLDDADSTSGCVVHSPEDLASLPTLSAESNAIALAALTKRLGVMIDVPHLRATASADAIAACQPTSFKGSWYQWPAVDAGYFTTQRLGGDPLDPLRMVHSLGFCNGVHLAPTVHAALNRIFKDTCIAWPFWAFADECAEFGPTGYSRSQDARLARLITGIQMCLKGSPVLPFNDIENWDKLAFDHCAQFVKWRRSMPTLCHGRMRLLPMHGNLLMLLREHQNQTVLCVFNLSDRYVRQAIPEGFADTCLIAGSGLDGGRIVNKHIDCDPWGAMFASIQK